MDMSTTKLIKMTGLSSPSFEGRMLARADFAKYASDHFVPQSKFDVGQKTLLTQSTDSVEVRTRIVSS